VEDLDTEGQKPSTSQENKEMGNGQFRMKQPFSMMPKTRRRVAHLAETLGEGSGNDEEWDEEEEMEEEEIDKIVEIIEDEVKGE
jgi:hypothetical protein